MYRQKMHKVLRKDTQGGPNTASDMTVALSLLGYGSMYERVARGEGGEITRRQVLKGLAHQINLSDLHLSLCFSGL